MRLDPIGLAKGAEMDDLDYLYRRAEEELERARSATVECVVSFHYRYAGLFLDRIYGAEGDPRAAAHAPAQ